MELVMSYSSDDMDHVVMPVVAEGCSIYAPAIHQHCGVIGYATAARTTHARHGIPHCGNEPLAISMSGMTPDTFRKCSPMSHHG